MVCDKCSFMFLRTVHGPVLRNALDCDFVRCPGRQGFFLWDVRNRTDAGRLKYIDVLSRTDVADSSHVIRVHDAIYSIARSSVFAQRHETAAYMWFVYLSIVSPLGTRAMLRAILPRSAGVRHPRGTVDVGRGAQGDDGSPEAF